MLPFEARDFILRRWFIFQLPQAVSFAPGSTEEEARANLKEHSYDKAPVHERSCTGSVTATRAEIAMNHLTFARLGR